MYVETGWPDNRMKSGRVARVDFSKSGRTLNLDRMSFIALGTVVYMEAESRDRYWFSGPRKDGNDRKGRSRSVPVEIDDDVRVEYWTDILQEPERAGERTT
jgi:hypothetical protein